MVPRTTRFAGFTSLSLTLLQVLTLPNTVARCLHRSRAIMLTCAACSPHLTTDVFYLKIRTRACVFSTLAAFPVVLPASLQQTELCACLPDRVSPGWLPWVPAAAGGAAHHTYALCLPWKAELFSAQVPTTLSSVQMLFQQGCGKHFVHQSVEK